MYPHERSLVTRMQGRPFVLIGVNSDTDLAALKPRLAAEQITWRSFWNGEQGTAGPISKEWLVSGWPTVFVIDHEGVIQHKSHGSDTAAMDRAIDECLVRAEAAQKPAK